RSLRYLLLNPPIPSICAHLWSLPPESKLRALRASVVIPLRKIPLPNPHSKIQNLPPPSSRRHFPLPHNNLRRHPPRNLLPARRQLQLHRNRVPSRHRRQIRRQQQPHPQTRRRSRIQRNARQNNAHPLNQTPPPPPFQAPAPPPPILA